MKRALEVVRRILRLAENWRDESGITWLERAPRISMPTYAELSTRPPYPLTWDEQQLLFELLPKHLADMALFQREYWLPRTRSLQPTVAMGAKCPRTERFCFRSAWSTSEEWAS